MGLHAKADTLLFENTLADSGGIGSFLGLGQELIVNTTTNLTGIAFDLSASNATTAEYMIWNGDNSLLLYTSQAVTVAKSTTKSWIEAPVTYTLNAGSTYFIAVLTAGNASLGNSNGPDVDSGFTAVADNGDYRTYGAPQYFGNGDRDIALQLYGTQTASVTPSAVPEPCSMALLGTGMFGMVGSLRRRSIA
jgi:PEP-CTERM motif